MSITTEVHERPVVAQRLKISMRKLDELIQAKQIKSLRIGKRRLISEEALQAFIRAAENAAR